MKTKVWRGKKPLTLSVPCPLARRPTTEVGNQDTTEFEGSGERPVFKTFHPWSLALGTKPWGQPGEFGWSRKRQSEVPERACFIGFASNKPDNISVEPQETEPRKGLWFLRSPVSVINSDKQRLAGRRAGETAQ